MSKSQYHQNGKPITNPSVNSLSGIAYFYTKGIDGKERITTDRLIEVLADLGVSDPRGSSFEVTLPNGRVIKAEAGAIEGNTRTPGKAKGKVAKKAPPTKAEKEARANKRAATIDQMKAAAGKLAKAGRASGAHRITVTKENAADILGMTLAAIKALPDEPVDVTPLPKPSTTRRRSTKGKAA